MGNKGTKERLLPAVSTATRKPRSGRTATLYFIECVASGERFIKIGYASNLAQRFCAIQNGCPFDLEIVAEVRCQDASAVEAKLHDSFRHLWVRGEWFRADAQLDHLIASLPSKSQQVARFLRSGEPSAAEPSTQPMTMKQEP